MKYLIRLFILSFFLMFTMFLSAQNLDKHQWNNRVLIIATSNSSSDLYLDQIREFKNANEELKDRKIVIYEVVGSEYKAMNYVTNKSTDSQVVSNDLINYILNKESEFSVTLIGLDSGIKLQQVELLKKEELLRIIDVMPMRRSEIRKKIKQRS